MKYIFLFLFFPLLLFSQGDDHFKLPEVIPPSPTVASLMQVEELPVEYYTGQPDISIPIFSKQIDGEKSLNIALRYSTSGVKVTERSGWVGTGWSLEAGGSISRTVRGTPDEANKSGNILTGIYNLPNNEFFNYTNLSGEAKGRYGWYVNGTSSDKYDSELDLYQYNILGATGRFVVVKENNTLKAKLLSKDENVQIQVGYTTGFKITNFTVTDATGYKYYFGGTSAIDVTTSNPNSMSQPQVGIVENLNPTGLNTTCTTAWHMTSIKLYNGTTLASFTYSAVTEKYESNMTMTKFTPSGSAMTYLQGGLPGNPNITYNAGVFKPKSTIGYSTISVATRKLNTITFKDGTKASFGMTTGHPEYDLNGSNQSGVKLTSLSLKDAANTVYKKFFFSYEQTNAPRLWLTRVTEAVSNIFDEGAMVHKFEYDQKENLPGYGLGDGWGYQSMEGLSSFGHIQKFSDGLLTRIVYPTGGVTDFTFEPHNFSYEAGNLLDQEDTNNNPYNQYAQSAYTDFTVTDNTCSPSFSNVFFIPYNQAASISINVNDDSYVNNPTGTTYPGRYYYSLKIHKTDASGNILSTPYILRAYDTQNPANTHLNYTKTLNEGYYKFEIRYNLFHPADAQYIVARATVNYASLKSGTAYTRALLAGGVRIKQINLRDNETTTDAERTFNYYYNVPVDIDFNTEGVQTVMPEDEASVSPFPFGGQPAISSGALDSRNGGYKCKYGYTEFAFLKYPTSGQCNEVYITYDVDTNEPHFELTKGSSVGYKYVRVREEGNGYKMFTYKTAMDEPYTNGCTYPVQAVPNFDYKRGLLLKEEIFDETNTIVKGTVNNYDIREEYVAPLGGIIDTHCKWARGYTNYDQYLQGIYPVNIDSGCYTNQPAPYNCGNAPYVFGSDSLFAGSADKISSNEINYFYDGSTVSSTETLSEFEYNTVNYQIKKETKTIYEGGSTNVYTTQYEYPVGGYTTSLFTSSENSVISQMAATGRNVINKPIVISNSLNNKPITKIITKYAFFSSVPKIKEMESIKNTYDADDRVIYSNYDASGNPLEVSLKDGPKVCYIWGYNETLPVAKIEGISGYSYISAVDANIINNIKTASNYSTYNETNLNTYLSNLRSLLPGAHVTTMTYKPGIGITSITDASGATTFYEYDTFNRLKFIKDLNGVIIQHYEYHYKN
ncbi:hypothetical protein [Flavobacterium beibuense]|uniref:hypothetical protein n=1 Tax=Flavobacterium beibuense TaxID=657326 RepID=UPI003A954F32